MHSELSVGLGKPIAFFKQTVYESCMVVEEMNSEGQIVKVYCMKDGEMDGPFISYWSNGNIRERMNYKSGIRCGEFIIYNYDGTVIETGSE